MDKEQVKKSVDELVDIIASNLRNQAYRNIDGEFGKHLSDEHGEYGDAKNLLYYLLQMASEMVIGEPMQEGRLKEFKKNKKYISWKYFD